MVDVDLCIVIVHLSFSCAVGHFRMEDNFSSTKYELIAMIYLSLKVKKDKPTCNKIFVVSQLIPLYMY